jgi:hypothetical protein
MSEILYSMGNFAAPSTLSPPPVSTGTAGSPSVMLQLATPASGTRQFSIVEYGVSMTGAPAGANLILRVTPTAATLGTAGTILPYSNVAAPASLAPSAVATSAWNSTGSTVAPAGTSSMVFDAQLLTTNTYIKQFPLGREPVVGVSGTQEFCQIVVNVPTTAVTMLCYIIWRE